MYKVIKRNCPVFGIGPYTCEFICDTASDIITLPTSISEGTGGRTAYDNQKCASGSIAIIAENGSESKQYMLNNQDIWCPYSIAVGNSGGGSSESSITVDFALSGTSENPVANKVIVAALNDKADTTHTHTANEVGADASGSAASALVEAKAYTDSKIVDAMAENQTAIEALEVAIGTKANKTDIPTKTSELENNSGFLTEHQDLSGYAKKTDIPTALPADGGNADTLDGLHSDSFALKTEIPTSLPANGGNADTIATVPINDIFISKTLQGISDIDNTDGNWSVGIVPSWESVSGTFPDNCPTWVVINQYRIPPDHFVIQICHGVGDNRIWMRGKHVGGSWGNWGDIYSTDNKPYVTGEIAFANQDGNSYTNSPVPTNHGFMPSKVLYWELPSDGMKEPYQVYSATSFDEKSFMSYAHYVTSGADGLPNVKPSYRYGYIIFK